MVLEEQQNDLENLEEEETEDTGDTLSPSEDDEESDLEEEADIPELNSHAHPTEDQESEAGLSDECEDCEEEENDLSSESEPEETSFSENAEGLTPEQQSVEKMLTQSQVNDLLGKTRVSTREKTRSDLFNRYGVNDETQLDDMAGRSQKYDLLREDYDNLKKELDDVKIRLAMYDSEISPERYEDARFILQGKGLEISPENLKAELETHPEWKKNYAKQQLDDHNSEVKELFQKAETKGPATSISRLGNARDDNSQSDTSERDAAMELFH